MESLRFCGGFPFERGEFMEKYAMLTRPGARENNEDAIWLGEKRENLCMLLADGLGGHGSGEVASAAAVATCKKIWEECGPEKFSVSAFFEECERKLEELQAQAHDFSGMKTTIVLCRTMDERFYCAHVGDSRMYYFRRGRILCRTLDHSVPQMLVFSKEIKERQIRNHPDRNRLLKVMGDRENELYFEEMEPIPIRQGDAVLMASDGFWENVEDREMQKTLKKSADPQKWLCQMEQIAVERAKNKNMDNYSAIAVWF
jgi:serine/threonine protein phosphatase PrpC